ncbi:MAG: intermembrane phospholipid transport protein YdbH family protein, partial [Alphaproteobacteria bacterium]
DVAITGPLEFALESGAGPLIELDLSDPGRMPMRFDFRLGPSPFRATVAGLAEDKLTFTGRTPHLAVAGLGDAADATFDAKIVAENGTATLPDHGLRLDGVGAIVRYARPAPASGRLASFRVDRLLLDGKPRPVVPLGLDGSVDRAGGTLTFAARLSDRNDRIVLRTVGAYDPAAASGEARISLAPLAFAPGRLQPGDLFPAIGKTVTEAAGRVAATGTARWSASGAQARLAIPIQDLSLTLEGVKLAGLSGTLDFDSGADAPPMQTLSIERLDLGLPLRDGRVRFRITPKLVFEVEEMTWHLAGGRLFARDLVIDPFAEKRGIVLEAEGIDVGQLLAHAESETVSATGRLGGRIPVEIIGGQVAIRDGLLETAAPGIIRYKHNVPVAEVRKDRPEIALMIQALENFHYERIGMTINQEPGGEALIALQIRGKNPDLMKGKPFVLNLNLSGNLVEIVGCFVEGYCSAEEIGQMILQFFE